MRNHFRTTYPKLEPEESARITRIKERAADLMEELVGPVDSTQRNFGCGREESLAITRLEECVMWAVKGATR